MSHPTPTNAEQSVPRSKGGFINTTLWVLQILTALAFLLAGTMKLVSAQEMVKTFDKIGVGQWFRYVTGSATSPAGWKCWALCCSWSPLYAEPVRCFWSAL
jgi:putative oxidoreductase